jgi:hypothetical protein
MTAAISTTRQRKTLEAWIHEALNDPDKEKPCSHLTLFHMVGPHEREIHSKKTAPAMVVKDLAELFKGKADTFAQDLVGVQHFLLKAFYGSPDSFALYPFQVTGELSFGGLSTEAPDARGEKQQGMRFSEMMVSLAYRQTGTLFDASNGMIGMLTQQNMLLMRENADAVSILKEIIFKQANDTHELRMKQLEYERNTQERAKWLGMAPPLVNMLAGKEVFPQSTADSALVEAIADSLTPDMLEKIGPFLPPQTTALLMTRFTEHHAKKEKAAEEAKALLTGSGGDPEKELA